MTNLLSGSALAALRLDTPMVDPLKTARLLRRLMLPLALLLGLGLYWSFGWIRVPSGMDTMPDIHPAGSLCFVLKRPSVISVGAVVFVDLPGGGTLLARVVTVLEEGFELAADNPKSTFADMLRRTFHSPEALRAQVITSFSPESSGHGR